MLAGGLGLAMQCWRRVSGLGLGSRVLGHRALRLLFLSAAVSHRSPGEGHYLRHDRNLPFRLP